MVWPMVSPDFVIKQQAKAREITSEKSGREKEREN
jgi:hypothetical protein